MNPTVRFLTRTGVLLAVALAMQMTRLPQPVTGPVINAVLLLASIYVGVGSGIVIGLLTPGIAFLVGILAAPLAPMIPVIMAANVTLVVVFRWTQRINSIVGVVAASVAKFLVFYLSLNYVLTLFGVKLPAVLLAAFGTPQLFTALVGGIIAVIIISKYPPETL